MLSDIVMDSVVEESAYFKIKSKTIKQWLRLDSDHQYLLGIGDREVTLISMYKIKDNRYQAHEYPIGKQKRMSIQVIWNQSFGFKLEIITSVLWGLCPILNEKNARTCFKKSQWKF